MFIHTIGGFGGMCGQTGQLEDIFMLRLKAGSAVLTLAALATLGLAAPAQAQEKYLGEIFLTAASFCPNGSWETNGQLVSVAQNTALFSLLGTTYGGNGTTTFALPDLRGRVPVGVGTGPGLQTIVPGEVSGNEQVTLLASNMPAHTHSLSQNLGGPVSVRTVDPGEVDPTTGDDVPAAMVASATGTAQLSVSGNNMPVPVRDPYLGMRYCIVETGIYPTRP